MKRISKRILITAAAAALLTYKTLFQQTSYTVTRVIDGDTFETMEKQRIRINGIQAPEKGKGLWKRRINARARTQNPRW